MGCLSLIALHIDCDLCASKEQGCPVLGERIQTLLVWLK